MLEMRALLPLTGFSWPRVERNVHAENLQIAQTKRNITMTPEMMRPAGPPANSVESRAPMLVDEREAARLLGVSPRTVFTLGKRGDLPRVLINRSVRYRVEDLKAFCERQAAKALLPSDCSAAG